MNRNGKRPRFVLKVLPLCTRGHLTCLLRLQTETSQFLLFLLVCSYCVLNFPLFHNFADRMSRSVYILSTISTVFRTPSCFLLIGGIIAALSLLGLLLVTEPEQDKEKQQQEADK